jgi:catechol 2,3-dioxygenase-like lactoylglutathione lyase family enzyme
MNETSSNSTPHFRGGPDIALRIPPSGFDATLAFYRDILRLPVLDKYGPDFVFQFGESRLWLDKVASLSQAEVWLQIITDDTAAARQHFTAHGVTRCDEIDSLPAGFDGFWVLSPSSIVHLVSTQ